MVEHRADKDAVADRDIVSSSMLALAVYLKYRWINTE
jgi:hypothetical protein